MERQDRAPLVDALKRYQKERPAYFCIPGHRYERGLGQRWLTKEECGFLKYDLTEVGGLDDLHRPEGVIREAQELLADLYGAQKSYFLVNGTTCGNEAMLLGTLKENDEIILPRNVHKSVLQGLILCGARPVYLMPKWIEKAGIWGGISPREVENALEHHPGAKAVFLVSPSYYGICCDVKRIADICHRFGVPLLVDEAHGSHLYFSSLLPRGALQQGADGCAQSFHKTTGALTQSSVLHIQTGRIDAGRIERALKLVQSTSPSYLLMASVDNSRYQLAHHGRKMAEDALEKAAFLREKIRAVPGMFVLGKDDIEGRYAAAALDETRLVFGCETMSGYDLASTLREEYQVETEMADLRNVVAVVTFANEEKEVTQLIGALRDISRRRDRRFLCKTGRKEMRVIPQISLPPAVLTPRQAFFAETKTVPWQKAVGKIAGEMIAPYPPGIPLLCPGERLTPEIMAAAETYRQEGCRFHGLEDDSLTSFKIIEKDR